MIFLYLFPCVKTWNYEQLLGGTFPRCLLPLHFLCFPTPIFFSGLKLLLAGVKQPIQSLNGYLNGEICMNQNQRGTYALYRAIFFFQSGSQMLSNGHPLRPGLKARLGMLATQVSQVPRTSQPTQQSRLQSQSKKTITLRESGAFGFVHRAWPAPGGRRRFTGSRRPSSSPRRRWAVPRSSSASRSLRIAHPLRLCFWPMSP